MLIKWKYVPALLGTNLIAKTKRNILAEKLDIQLTFKDQRVKFNDRTSSLAGDDTQTFPNDGKNRQLLVK